MSNTALQSEFVPVVAGLTPDPTICRVGDTYYLAHSSMEYSPSIPIWRSGDLVSWEQIGNALTRDEQFPSGTFADSAGIYAPTLRYRDGVFSLITTDVGTSGGGQILFRTSDPAGDWGTPVRFPDIDGIDPDLCWDADGTALISYCSWGGGVAGIKQVPVDLDSGTLLAEPEWIWHGSGLSHPEGPHLYRRGEWWYLVIAEGGTAQGHAISVARSRSPRGPFEGHPSNPIFSRRSIRHEVQNVGHADFVESPDGSWHAVHLGVRALGRTPRFHANGRETFLADVRWENDWPVITPSTLTPLTHGPIIDDFSGEHLHARWISPGLRPEHVISLDGEGLLLSPATAPSGAPSGIFTRIPWLSWSCAVDLETGSNVELMLRLDSRHFYAVRIENGEALGISHVGDVEAVVRRTAITSEPARLMIESIAPRTQGPDSIRLSLEQSGTFTELAVLDGRYLSTEVATGFTGRVIGLVARGADPVRVREFRVEGTV